MYIYVTVTFEMAWLKQDKITYMFHLFEATEIGSIYKAYHVYWSSVWKSQCTVHIGLQCTRISKLTTINTY